MRLKFLCLYFIIGCTNILDTSETRLFEIKVRSREETLQVNYFAGNATVSSAVQVLKVLKGSRTTLLANYDNYNKVDTAYLENDSVLLLVGLYHINESKVDTARIVIPKD